MSRAALLLSLLLALAACSDPPAPPEVTAARAEADVAAAVRDARIAALEREAAEADMAQEARWRPARAAARAAADIALAVTPVVLLVGGVVWALQRRRVVLPRRSDGALPFPTVEHADALAALAGRHSVEHAVAVASAQVPQTITYSPHTRYNHEQTGVDPLPPAPTAIHVPTFAELLSSGTIGKGQPLYLGMTADGPLTGKWSDIYSAGLAGLQGSGKALALDTPVPTPAGWMRMGDLVEGDRVFGADGRPCRVVKAWPVMHDRDCYEVEFNDGATVVADADHLWHTFTSTERGSLLKHTDEWRAQRRQTRVLTGTGAKPWLAERNRLHPTATAPPSTGAVRTTTQIAASLRTTSGAANHSIGLAGPLQYPDRDLPIDPYVLGAWLGDGTSREAAITSGDSEIIGQIEDAGYRCTPWAAKNRCGVWGVGSLSAPLAALGLLNDTRPGRRRHRGGKHIPRVYLEAGRLQRLALLQGLMDTDGSVSIRGTCEFTSTTRELADGVHELAVTLGIKASISEGRATLDGRDCGPKWRVTWTSAVEVFRLPRKAARLSTAAHERRRRRYIVDVRRVESVPVRCITVDAADSLYLATRSCVPTHNTWTAADLGLQALLHDADLYVVDPHHGHPESLGTRLEAAAHLLATPVASEVDDVMDLLHRVTGILDGRRGGGTERRPVLLEIDEWTNFQRGPHGAEMSKLVEAFTQEGRKLGVDTFLLGQRWSSTRRGGNDLRDTLTSAIVHRTHPADARMLTGRRAGALPSDTLELRPGECYLQDTAGAFTRIQIPKMAEGDAAAAAAVAASRTPATPLPCPAAEALPAGVEGRPEGVVEGSQDPAFSQVTALLARGGSLAAARDLVAGETVRGGRAYQAANDRLTRILQALAEGRN